MDRKICDLEHRPAGKAGAVVLEVLRRAAMGGRSWLTPAELGSGCLQAGLADADFQRGWKTAADSGDLCARGGQVYLTEILRCENLAAEAIAGRLRQGGLPRKAELPLHMVCGGGMLNDCQRAAVEMALSNRISMILGGAGCGKTTIIEAIAKYGKETGLLACAPTGKAARNLKARTGLDSGTVHGVLGVKPEESFLDGMVEWKNVGIVVVDECSMLTVDMLAGLLAKAGENCRIVLVGDPGQLPAVGPGNVISDLLAAGVPFTKLSRGYRQNDKGSALWRNVQDFDRMRCADGLRFDSSFVFEEVKEREFPEQAWKFYRDCLRRGEEVQVLSPVNSGKAYAADTLNLLIQSRIHGSAEDKAEYRRDNVLLRDGDRILITRNNWPKGCVNGDVGWLRLRQREGQMFGEAVLESGSVVACDSRLLQSIKPAYAMTVHKSQGSQYHTVLLPVYSDCGMMYRNLLYTAISRATDRVILMGDRRGLDMALRRRMRPRHSDLTEKVRRCLQNAS